MRRDEHPLQQDSEVTRVMREVCAPSIEMAACRCEPEYAELVDSVMRKRLVTARLAVPRPAAGLQAKLAPGLTLSGWRTRMGVPALQ
jgi:hypothetical protein